MVPGGTSNVVDPFQVMREMLSLDPLRQIFGGNLLQRMPLQQFVPQFEVRETDDAYVFKADMPGVSEEDLEITIERNRLTVSGQREMEQRDEKDRYYAVERAYGAFTRTFTLPGDIDESRVEAELKEGVLTLKIPKSREQQAKKVQLKGGSGGGAKTAKATSA
jgi:HSP20 family protein